MQPWAQWAMFWLLWVIAYNTAPEAQWLGRNIALVASLVCGFASVCSFGKDVWR